MNVKFGDSSLNLKVDGSLANIDRGPRGYSAYEIAVQEGFVGTEEEWLASLVGPEGKQGKDGERGIQGPRGQQGDKGDKGEKGDTGPHGDKGDTGPSNVLSIGSVTKGDEANATITGESPNQILNLVLPKGDKGDKGETGPQGETGATGNGILSIQKTATAGLVDTYTTTFTNGTTTTFDVTNGEDGEVTQKQLDETNENVSWLQTLTDQMPHVAGQGTDLSLEGTLNYRLMKFLPQGVSSQFSTRGVQLFDKNNANILNAYINSTNKTILSNSNARTLYIPCESNTEYTVQRIAGQRFVVISTTELPANNVVGTVQVYNQTSSSLTITTGANDKYLCVFYYLSTADTLTEQQILDSIQIEEGSTATSYEPYTGGISAPNPSYPYPVKSVTGENSLVICNENLFDKNSPNWFQTYIGQSTHAISTNTSNTNFKTIYIKCLPNTNYYIKKFIETGILIMGTTEFEPTLGMALNDYTLANTPNSTFLTGENANYLVVQISSNTDINNGYTAEEITNNLSITKGSTAPTTYVEHEEQNYPITLKSNNLIGLDTAQYPVDLKAGDKVTFKNQASNVIWLQFYTNYGDETRNDFWSINPNQIRTITVAKNSKAVSWNVEPNNGIAWANKGETLQEYHPYTENPIELNLSTNRTIRDQIVGKPNEWYKREYIGKVVFDGSNDENWAKNSLTYYVSGDFPLTLNAQCSHFIKQPNYNWNSSNENYKGKFSMANVQGQIKFMPIDGDISSTTLWRNWLSENNITVWYQKSEYTDIPITDTTLINQLNDIYNNAHSYNGITNITTTYEDGNEQMYLDIEALAKGGSTATETDPIFSASASSGITSSDITNWDNKADVEDIPDLTDYVKNTDYASSSKGGVIKVGNGNSITAQGILYPNIYSYANYQNLSNNTYIGKGTLENVITGKNLADKNYVDTAIATAITNTLGGSY